MDGSQTAIEKAFELAKSGQFKNVEDIIRQLRREGFRQEQIEGRALKTQLRLLIQSKEREAPR